MLLIYQILSTKFIKVQWMCILIFKFHQPLTDGCLDCQYHYQSSCANILYGTIRFL